MASASKGYFGLSEEATPGVAVATPEAFYPVQSVDFPFENQYLDNYEIRGSRQALTSLPGAVEGSATVSGVMYPSGAMGKILRGLFGDVSSEGTTNYTHTFGESASGSLPYFTLERADAFAAEGGQFAEQLSGAKVESLAIECPFGDLVTFTANFMAIKAPKVVSAASRPGVAPWPTTRAVTFQGAAISVDGDANSDFTNLSIEFTNNLIRQNTLNGTSESSAIDEGGMSCTLSGTAVFRDMTLRNKLEAGDEFEVEMVLSNGKTLGSNKEGFKFVWPRVKLSSVGLPMQANEVITSDVTFRIDFDDAENAAVLATMYNTEDGSAYL